MDLVSRRSIASQPAPATYSGCDWINLYSDWNQAVMRAICQSESSGLPDNTNYNQNGTADRGLLQINSIHADMVRGDLQSLYDPAVNVTVGHQLWLARGYQPWSSYNTGQYKQFLN